MAQRNTYFSPSTEVCVVAAGHLLISSQTPLNPGTLTAPTHRASEGIRILIGK